LLIGFEKLLLQSDCRLCSFLPNIEEWYRAGLSVFIDLHHKEGGSGSLKDWCDADRPLPCDQAVHSCSWGRFMQERKMASDQRDTSAMGAFAGPLGMFTPVMDYMIDAAQRGVLFCDVMRQRGNQYRERLAETVPHVLDYEVELVVDGRTLDRPVNYALARVIPPAGIEFDSKRRPFVVVDPRAGHGPGIGGFKADSEIGVAFKAGHPCYFIGFLPEPMPGQTIEDIARAEAVFLEKVIALHPEADGKPCVIGNCQAGWAVMMLAAIRPELFGPIIVAGSPLSYWAGVRGKFPMRYSGGLLGGSWLTALTGDLGHGKFDGAWLVQNFENQNPANTLWSKPYNLYSKIDTEAPRYLGFEKWWGGHVNLNAEEIQFIVDELFIGNNLAAGRIQTSNGTSIDLRNIRSPIVVFCSKGDNITPPQQALGWILDLYENVDEIRSCGQTIVYTIHETIGHLGIFVSGGVAKKEHGEFSSNIDLIDTLPPGLYEAVLENKAGDTANPDLVTGNWVMRCEARTLDDIRALGGNDAADERRFATAARVSEINLSLYRTFAQPMVRAMVNSPMAEWMQQLHPLRLQYEFFSNANPLMAPVATLAEQVRKDRKPSEANNPFVAMQENASRQIVAGLDAWRDMTEALAERTFLTIYGLPSLQAAVGLDPAATRPLRQAAKSPLHQELLQKRIAELKSRIPIGGLREAVIRGLLYAGMTRAAIDERGFELTRRIRQAHGDIPLSDFKALVREQFNMLLIDQEGALRAIPAMLPSDAEERRKAFDLIKQVLGARGEMSPEDEKRMSEVARLFDVDDKRSGNQIPFRRTRKELQNRAS
jgi:pimeloyl-ACP methyl ester carboxylesterase